jgi:hypothetical protein
MRASDIGIVSLLVNAAVRELLAYTKKPDLTHKRHPYIGVVAGLVPATPSVYAR